VAEGLARVFQLLAPIITVGGARALDSSVGAGVIVFLAIIPNDLVIWVHLIGSEAGQARGRILHGLQSKQVLPEPDRG
jgi:hypothetical protein